MSPGHRGRRPCQSDPAVNAEADRNSPASHDAPRERRGNLSVSIAGNSSVLRVAGATPCQPVPLGGNLESGRYAARTAICAGQAGSTVPLVCMIRDEEVVGSNPAIPTTKPQVEGPNSDSARKRTRYSSEGALPRGCQGSQTTRGAHDRPGCHGLADMRPTRLHRHPAPRRRNAALKRLARLVRSTQGGCRSPRRSSSRSSRRHLTTPTTTRRSGTVGRTAGPSTETSTPRATSPPPRRARRDRTTPGVARSRKRPWRRRKPGCGSPHPASASEAGSPHGRPCLLILRVYAQCYPAISLLGCERKSRSYVLSVGLGSTRPCRRSGCSGVGPRRRRHRDARRQPQSPKRSGRGCCLAAGAFAKGPAEGLRVPGC